MEFVQLNEKFVSSKYQEINTIVSQYFPNYDIRNYKYNHKFFYILFNKKIVGFFNIFLKNRIQKFAIFKEYQSKGLGTAAVKKIMEIVKKPYCFVIKKNEKALNFWKKNGFVITDDLGNVVKMES